MGGRASLVAACALIAGCDRVFGLIDVHGDRTDDSAVDSPSIDAGELPTDVVQIAAGGSGTCVRLRAGDVWCWGSPAISLTATAQTSPRQVIGGGATSIAIGDAGACAVLTGGSAVCWGDNQYGQLASGITGSHSTLAMRNAGSDAATDIAAIAVGYDVACVLRTTGTVACAGRSAYLGDGSTSDRALLGDVSGIAGAIQVTAGDSHACALIADGSACCWGDNASGQLGIAMPATAATPVLVPGSYKALAAGDAFTCGRLDTGVACWGSNFAGELGDGTLTARSTPMPIATLPDATAIDAGAATGYAVRADGTLSAWGLNDYGELGDGSTSNRTLPGTVRDLADVVEVSSRTSLHACALTRDGGAWCWGRNDLGQLGDGSFTTALLPQAVVGLPTQ